MDALYYCFEAISGDFRMIKRFILGHSSSSDEKKDLLGHIEHLTSTECGSSHGWSFFVSTSWGCSDAYMGKRETKIWGDLVVGQQHCFLNSKATIRTRVGERVQRSWFDFLGRTFLSNWMYYGQRYTP